MFDSGRPYRRQPTRFPRSWNSPGKNTGVGCHFLLQCMKAKSESEVAQSCPTLSGPMDCSLPGSSVRGIFQARVLEWGVIAFSALHLLVTFNNFHFLEYHRHSLGWLPGQQWFPQSLFWKVSMWSRVGHSNKSGPWAHWGTEVRTQLEWNSSETSLEFVELGPGEGNPVFPSTCAIVNTRIRSYWQSQWQVCETARAG